jgi:hypothetical protein
MSVKKYVSGMTLTIMNVKKYVSGMTLAELEYRLEEEILCLT